LFDWVARIVFPALTLGIAALGTIRGTAGWVPVIFLGAAAASVAIPFTPTAWRRLRASLALRKRITEARAAVPRMKRLLERLGEFVAPSRGDTLHSILRDTVGPPTGIPVERMGPASINIFYALWEHLTTSPVDSRHPLEYFGERSAALDILVEGFNDLCVLATFERLPEEYKRHCSPARRRDLELFRERWVRFLDDYDEYRYEVEPLLPQGARRRRLLLRPKDF